MLFKNKIKVTNSMKLVELKFGKPIYELLREDYTNNRMTIKELSEKYDITAGTIHAWLKLFDVPRRKMTFI